ncbi:transposase [Nitrosomonas marina]|uniref:transposase n=1 Tax=Nitrosomonas marina TaxID=917 RepID=UPI00210CC574|nr:transposase [Nitrosomonas marina]
MSELLTSASTYDSQVAIPLMHMSDERVINLYDLMGSAYDVLQIREACQQLGHVSLIDVNPRRNPALKEEIAAENKRCRLVGHRPAEAIRYNERITVEHVNAQLKDEFGGRMVRVRGHTKVMCHLMFGILALTANQLMTFIT